MELFAREHQHEPRHMLRDLLKLYMMNSSMTPPEAAAAITKDVAELVAQLAEERERRRQGGQKP